MFDEIFGKFNSGPNRGGSNAIGDFAKILEEKKRRNQTAQRTCSALP